MLDPACGTGNFLYVALELMKRLEGEVLETIASLGGVPDEYFAFPDEVKDRDRRALMKAGRRFTVDPHQFYGLELNPRAVPIADLVLWIGYLKWQLKTGGKDSVAEPVLDAYGTIRHQDALIDYDGRTPRKNDDGSVTTIWDGRTMKRHPVTDKLVPDETGRIIDYLYEKPKIAQWPDCDFVIGNPPFIGNKLLRKRLGNGYVDTLFAAFADLPNNIDLVMYWWDRAAALCSEGAIRSFGFVSTNGQRQVSNRQIVTRSFARKNPICLSFAIPDHPWVDDAKAAQVRVSMTVGAISCQSPKFLEVTNEHQDTLSFKETVGKTVNSDLTIGVDVTNVFVLWSNRGLSFQGCKLGHDDFIIPSVAGYSNSDRALLCGFYGGDEIKFAGVPSIVIDAFGIGLDTLKERHPAIYHHLAVSVKPFKDQVSRDSHRLNWWLFGEPRPEMRAALYDLKEYVATVETSKHRFFTVLSWPEILIDGSVIAIATESLLLLFVLTSRIHCEWSFRRGGRQGVGNDPRYQNSQVFDSFPFPNFDGLRDALRSQMAERALELFRLRGNAVSANPGISLTDIYNVLERYRLLNAGYSVSPLSPQELSLFKLGNVLQLSELHDEIDRTVLEAYNWADLIPDIVGKPGATSPSLHKTSEQKAAEEDLLIRLVALNQTRAAGEAKGKILWLRPEYQIPKFAARAPRPEDGEQIAADLSQPSASEEATSWPADGLDQIRLVRDILTRATTPLTPKEITRRFKGGRNRGDRIVTVLRHMEETGMARSEAQAYFVPQ